jgi:TonB family protein
VQSRIDTLALLCALAAHAGIAYGLARVHVPERNGPSVLEVDVRKREPLPPPKVETPPEPPKPEPEPPRKVVQKEKKIVTPPPMAPPPNQEPPKEPPKDPPKPVFGVTMDSTTEGESSVAVPVGNTTMIDPKNSAKHSGPIAPLPAAPQAPAKQEYKPVSDVYIKDQPEIDGEACGRAAKYTDEAEQLGIEGTVKLRIELDEKGSVHAIKVLAGLGHGLDEVAVRALRSARECKFKPAIGTDGKPAPYVISSYLFRFELQR